MTNKDYDENVDYCSYFPEEWLGIKIKDCCLLDMTKRAQHTNFINA